MFLERVSSTGMAGNKYWYDKNFNKGAGTVNGLPNCTCFAVGETYEAMEVTEPYQLFRAPFNRPGALPTAKNFYSLWIGKRGIEPKVGGIAVWGNAKAVNGHVAFVLETKDAGKKGAWIKVCQSNFGGTYFEVKEYYVKQNTVTEGVGFPYVGCCYNAINDKRVARNTDLLQVEVKADALNVRNAPNGTVYSGRVCPKGLYTIYDTQKAGSYTWAKLDDGYWIALNDKDGWTVTLQPTNCETLEQKYRSLVNAYEILSEKYTELVLRYEKETGKKV